jgi:hypothetical protein
MSNLQGNGPPSENRVLPARQTTGSWLAAAVLVVIILLGVGYMFKDRWKGSAQKVETRATATDAPLYQVLKSRTHGPICASRLT